jgi:hypothetical protein
MMSPSEPGRYDICPQCKAGAPLRWRDDTNEWIHEHIRTNDALRQTTFSQVICLANDLRKQDASNG